jgi:hypothetical protein
VPSTDDKRRNTGFLRATMEEPSQSARHTVIYGVTAPTGYASEDTATEEPGGRFAAAPVKRPPGEICGDF